MKTKDHHLSCRNGIYYLVYQGLRKSLHTKDPVLARRMRGEMISRIDSSSGIGIVEIPKFNVLCEQWLVYKEEGNLREETIYKWTTFVNNILSTSAFYYRSVDRIDDLMVEDWWHSLKCKPQTINYYLTILSNIFKFARKRKYIQANLMELVERPKIEERVMPDPFTMKERDRIIDATPTWYQEFVITKFYTGMRTSEVCGLKKECVDLDRNVIRVRERLLKGQTAPCKNQYSNREIKLLPQAREAIVKAMLKSSCEYVFVNEQGKPIHSSTISDTIWKDTLVKGSIRYRPIKNTRHTFISMAVASGADLMYVARQVGHSSTEMIHKHYEGYIPKDDNFDLIAQSFAQQNVSSGVC